MNRNGSPKERTRASQTKLILRQPTFAESLIPVVGPAWEAVADFQEGDVTGGVFNTAMVAADLLPTGVALKGIRAASKGVGILKKGSVTADASRKILRKKGFAGVGDQIHHTIPLNGKSRNAQDPRNHYAFLKVLPREQHRRLTGSWNGKARYDPLRRLWYGTTDWQKAYPGGVATKILDAFDPFAEPAARDVGKRKR